MLPPGPPLISINVWEVIGTPKLTRMGRAVTVAVTVVAGGGLVTIIVWTGRVVVVVAVIMDVIVVGESVTG